MWCSRNVVQVVLVDVVGVVLGQMVVVVLIGAV